MQSIGSKTIATLAKVVTPPSKPSLQVLAQPFHTRASLMCYEKDFLFGTMAGKGTGGLVQQMTTVELAAVRRLAADYPMLMSESPLGPDDTKGAHTDYRRAFQSLQAKGALPAGKLFDLEQATSALQFTPGKRGSYLAPTALYMQFLRAIVHTALARGGEVGFACGYFCLHQHYLSTMKVEIGQGTDFASYAKTATVGMLRPARQAPKMTGAEEPGATIPSITSVEFAAFTEGDCRSVAVQFYSSQGVQLDRHAFLELSKEAIGQTRSKDNKEHFLKTGSLLPQALTALQEHQQFVHGFPQPLSQAPELSSR